MTSVYCSDAGIDDWGGVSPVTADHVNPERPWPDLDILADVTTARGRTLAPRLTVYPEYVHDPDRWLHPDLHYHVMDRSDAEGLGRDDPGEIWPEKITAADTVGDGAEFVLIGKSSTCWYPGAQADPPTARPRAGRTCPRARGGSRSKGSEVARSPVSTRSSRSSVPAAPRSPPIAEVADQLRADTVGDVVTWVNNRNINYTNVCTFKCRFCGFSKGPLSLNLRGTPYLLTLDDIAERAAEGWDLGATEVTLQGGIHPNFDGDYYIDVAKGGEGGCARHARARVHRAGGHRRCTTPRRRPRRPT